MISVAGVTPPWMSIFQVLLARSYFGDAVPLLIAPVSMI